MYMITCPYVRTPTPYAQCYSSLLKLACLNAHTQKWSTPPPLKAMRFEKAVFSSRRTSPELTVVHLLSRAVSRYRQVT